jgi:hypothetical protein
MIPPVSVCHQVSTIGHDPADVLVVPHPGLGVDGLAHRPEEPELRQVVLLRPLPPPRMKARMAVGAV